MTINQTAKICALLMAVSLVACSKSEAPVNTTSETSAPTTATAPQVKPQTSGSDKTNVAEVKVAPVPAAATVAMPAIAKKNNCVACHAIDKKMVGPSWMDISKKYKGDASAKANLLVKVSKGGSGTWGSVAMPANDAAGTKQADMKELVSFILGLAK